MCKSLLFASVVEFFFACVFVVARLLLPFLKQRAASFFRQWRIVWCVGSSKCACFHRIIVCKTLKICSNSVIFKFRLKVWLLLHVCVFSLHNRLDVTTTHARTPNSTKPICNEPSHQQNPEEICSAKRSNPNTEITYEMNKRKRVQ